MDATAWRLEVKELWESVSRFLAVRLWAVLLLSDGEKAIRRVHLCFLSRCHYFALTLKDIVTGCTVVGALTCHFFGFRCFC